MSKYNNFFEFLYNIMFKNFLKMFFFCFWFRVIYMYYFFYVEFNFLIYFFSIYNVFFLEKWLVVD